MGVDGLATDACLGGEFRLREFGSRERVHERVKDVSDALVLNEDAPATRVFVAQLGHRQIIDFVHR